MSDNAKQISELLHEAGETHHVVFRITDGADDDWASWYSDWLTQHSELPDLLPKKPVRSELTSREWEVLDLLCERKTTDEMATDLFLSPETVRSHVKSIYRKLGVSSRDEAIARSEELRQVH